MLVGCVLLLVMNYGETEIFGCFLFWGSCQGQGGSVSLDVEGWGINWDWKGFCSWLEQSLAAVITWWILVTFWFITELLMGTYFFVMQSPSNAEHGWFWSGGRCWYIQGW